MSEALEEINNFIAYIDSHLKFWKEENSLVNSKLIAREICKGKKQMMIIKDLVQKGEEKNE